MESVLEVRSTRCAPDSRSTVTTEVLRSGAPPMKAATPPSTPSESMLVHGSGIVCMEPFESSRPSRHPAPVRQVQTTAPLASNPNVVVPSCHNGFPNSCSARTMQRSSPPCQRWRFHQPSGSVTHHRAPSGDQAGWKAELSEPPAMRVGTPGDSVPVELGKPQRRRIPGHVGLVPCEPRKVPPVGARGGCGVEVVAGGEHPFGAVVDRYRDEVIDGRGIAAMRLAHREQAPPPQVEGQSPRTGPSLARSREPARRRPPANGSVRPRSSRTTAGYPDTAYAPPPYS